MPESSSSLKPMLRKLRQWRELDAADEDALLTLPHRIAKIERASYLVREGKAADHVCLLVKGYAIRHKIVATGARQIVGVHMRGDLVDLQNALLRCADHNVQALTDVQVAYIPSEAIKRLAFARPSVGEALWVDTLVDAAIFREWIVNVGRRDARARIAHLFCELALRLRSADCGDTSGFELPMSQEQIADCVGLTSVHVNRVLMRLEAEQLISRKSSRSVAIGDWTQLAAAGDFDESYLHLREKAAH